MPAVVTDTGPLIHLSEADALGLLELFDRIQVPETVFSELEQGGLPPELESLNYERVATDVPDEETDLDPGERAALRLAVESDSILLTDDLAARETAESRGVETHGSIGVVLYARSAGRVDAETAKELLRSLESDTTLYLDPALLDHAIALVERRGGWD